MFVFTMIFLIALYTSTRTIVLFVVDDTGTDNGAGTGAAIGVSPLIIWKFIVKGAPIEPVAFTPAYGVMVMECVPSNKDVQFKNVSLISPHME